MEIRNNRVVPNKKGSGAKTEIRSVRGESEFGLLVDRVAEIEETNRNELILRVMKMYCDRRMCENGRESNIDGDKCVCERIEETDK